MSTDVEQEIRKKKKKKSNKLMMHIFNRMELRYKYIFEAHFPHWQVANKRVSRISHVTICAREKKNRRNWLDFLFTFLSLNR